MSVEGGIGMAEYTTVFGSLAHYEKGRVEIIQDQARHYAFSNIFEVAARRTAV